MAFHHLPENLDINMVRNYWILQQKQELILQGCLEISMVKNNGYCNRSDTATDQEQMQKSASKRVVQKTAEATGDLIENKIKLLH